jgi:hypothetical protein
MNALSIRKARAALMAVVLSWRGDLLIRRGKGHSYLPPRANGLRWHLTQPRGSTVFARRGLGCPFEFAVSLSGPTITRRRLLALLSSGFSVLLLGTHAGPRCVRWGDSRTFERLGSYTFTHLSRSC